ncbi:MAG: HlyD family secretion protein, partial [Bryobacteraceae bacterium]
MAAILKLWRERRVWVILAGVAVFALALSGVTRIFGTRASAASISAPPGVPTAEVTRGELVDTIELRGDIKAARSAQIVTPQNAGDLQIVKLAKNGTMVKKGDVVVVLDPNSLLITLNQRRSDLKQAEAQVADARAKAKLVEEQDQTDMLAAKFNVESAKLDVSKAEILSQIDGEKNKLALADAEQKLIQAQQKLESDKQSDQADIAGVQQKRMKAQRDVQQYEDRLAHMTLRAPVDGMVNLQPNWRSGNFGGSSPPFKEGDQAWSGATVAELPDLSTLRIDARLDESERGRLHKGDVVTARVDAVP